MPDDVLVLDALGKNFGATVALDSLTCRVARGEIVGLLGPNGAGKTTTMKLVLGMLRPTRGSAQFLGLDCTRDAHEVKRRLGYSPDEPSFYDFLSGRETIDFVLNVRGVPRDAAWATLMPVVERLELAETLQLAAGGYSHGTKKKLALALALAHEPTLLLLDEPTNGLDPPTAARVRFRQTLRSLGVDVQPDPSDGDVRLVVVLVPIVLAPLAEEIFFRGWLQNAIEGELAEHRRWLAPLLAAFAFASLRTPMSFAPALALGLVTGLLYARTRSVAPGVAAHIAYVVVSLAARYALGA